MSLEQKPRVPLRQKIYLGLASAGSNVLQSVYLGGLMMFYLDVMHMNPVNYGLVYLLFAIWNALNDPLFGYVSDRRKARPGRGKRIFFMRLAIPSLLLGFWLFWLPSPEWDQVALFLFLFLALFLYDTGFTIYVLNHCAISTGMTDDAAERASISLVVTLVNVVPAAIMGFVPTFMLTSGFPQWAVAAVFSACGGIGAIFMAVGVSRIQENTVFYIGERPLPLKSSLKITFQSRAFLVFVVYSFSMGGVALTLGTTMLFYFKFVFELEGLMVLLPGIIAGGIQVALYPLIQWISAKITPRKTLFLFVSGSAIGYCGLIFVQDFAWMVACYGLCMWGAAAHWLLLNAMVGDIADEDELKTGQRREGAFFGVHALIAAPALSILTAIFTAIIDSFGYTAAFGDTPDVSRVPLVLVGIRIGVGLVPLLFLLNALIFLYLFPLKGERYKSLKAQVNALHQAAPPMPPA